MSDRDCPRARDAEAFVDGRLPANAHAAWRTHAQSCEACARELRELYALRSTMHALPALVASAARVRAARRELEGHVDSARRRDGHAARRNAYLMFAVALVAIAAFIIERNVFRARPFDAPTVASSAVPDAPVFGVANVDGAVWESTVEGSVARTKLDRGVAELHVEHLRAGQRFLVTLPDGELEVHGTRFIVRIDEGKTTSVEVSEGVVALRMRGQPERFVRAGERWPAPPASEPTAAPPSSLPTAPAVVPTAAPTTSVRIATASASADPKPPVLPEAAGERYVAATRAFQAGSYARADALLSAFMRDFPRDPRCEDAAFLRAISHARIGDSAGAATLARAYLRAYPNGLRRREAEQLAGDR